jgi:NADH-quinone oxidoreductase subunit C
MAYTNEQVLHKLKEKFPQDVLHSEESYGMLSVEVNRNQWCQIISWLKTEPSLQLSFLTDLTGVHFPHEKSKEFGVVAHLHCFPHNFRMRIKAFMPAGEPTIDSLVPVFDGANWMERETFDFFGIRFSGHPNLKRILNMDEMDYHPMRKEYHLEDETREDKENRYFGR